MGIFKSLRALLLRKYRKKHRRHDVSDILQRCGSASSLSSWARSPRQCSDQSNTDSGAPSGDLRGHRMHGPVDSGEVDAPKSARRNASSTGSMISNHVLSSPKIMTDLHSSTSANRESYPDMKVAPRMISNPSTFEVSDPKDMALQKEAHSFLQKPSADVALSSFDDIPPQPIVERKEGTYTVTVHRRKRHALTHLGDPNPKPRTHRSALNDSRLNTASTSSSCGNFEGHDATSPQSSGTSSIESKFSRNGLAETNMLSAFNDDSSIANILKLYDDDGLLPNELFSNTPQRTGHNEVEHEDPRSSDGSNHVPDAVTTAPMTNSHLAELAVSPFASESPVSAGQKNALPIAPLCISPSADSPSPMPLQTSAGLETNSTLFGTSYSVQLANRLRLSSPMLFDFLFSPESIFFASQAGGNTPDIGLSSNLFSSVEPEVDTLPVPHQRASQLDPSLEPSSTQKSATLLITQSLLDRTDTYTGDTGTDYLDAVKYAPDQPPSLVSPRETSVQRCRDTSFSVYSTPIPSQLGHFTPGSLSSCQCNAQSQPSSASQSILGHSGAAFSDSEEAVVETAIIETVQWMASPATATYMTPSPSLTLSPDPSAWSDSPALALASPIVPITPDTPRSNYGAGNFDVSKLRGSPIHTEHPWLHPRSASGFSGSNQLGTLHDEWVDDSDKLLSSTARRPLTSYPCVSGPSRESIDIRRARGTDARSENRKAFLYGPANNESLNQLRAMLSLDALDDEVDDRIPQFIFQTAQSTPDDPFIPIPSNSSLDGQENATTALRPPQAYLKYRHSDHFNDSPSTHLRPATHSRSRIPRFCGSTKVLQPFPGGKENIKPLTGRQSPKKLSPGSESKAVNSGYQDQDNKDGAGVPKHLVPSFIAHQGNTLAMSSSRALGPTCKMSFGWDLRESRVLATQKHFNS